MYVLFVLLVTLFILGVFFGIPILVARSIFEHKRMLEIERQLRLLSKRLDGLDRTVSQSALGSAHEPARPAADEAGEQQPAHKTSAGKPANMATPDPTVRETAGHDNMDADRVAGKTDAFNQDTGEQDASEYDTQQPQPTSAAQAGDTPPPAARPPAGSGAPPAPPPATPPASIEERLGTRWAVYLGGIAIALGGIFLVRHAIEVGLLGPAARVILGAMLGLMLIGLGSRMRWREVDVVYGVIGGAHVPSVLTAAGTVVLFASAYAAYGLYSLIGASTAFVLLGLIGLGTLAAALLHGSAVAGLGLAGALLTPALIATATPNPSALTVYLAVISVAAYALARMRRWLWLAAAATAGAALWAVFMLFAGLAQDQDMWHLPAMAHILAQTAIAALMIAVEPHIERRLQEAHPDRIATAVLAALACVIVFSTALLPFENGFFLLYALLAIAILAAAAHVAPPVAAAGVFAALVMAAILIRWPATEFMPAPADYYGAFDHLIRLPQAVTAFLTFAGLTSLALAAAATHQLWLRPQLPAKTSAVVALAAVLPPLLALMLSYLRVTGFGTAISYTLIGTLLAAGFAVLAEVFDRRAKAAGSDTWRYATGAFATAAIAALAIAMVAGLQRGYLTVAFAMAAAGTAFIADRKQIPLLRYAAGALALIVLARVIWDPRIMGADVGSVPILNWLLIGYGVPALCFAIASHYLRRERDDVCSRLADVLAVIFTALLGVYQIRHVLYAGDPLAQQTGHVEMGLQAVLMLALSHGLARLLARRPGPAIEILQWAAAGLGAAIIVLGLGIVFNPAFADEAITGGVPFSSLVPAYLAPGLMALYLARHSGGLRPHAYVLAAAIVALALILTYVTLETRHAFHGADIRLRHGFEQPEMWALTIVWLLLAIVYLAYGLVRGSVPARAASGMLLVVTTAKVGIFDLAGVTGLWRALSFLCLGAVLIGIGIIYQKLIFQARRPRPPETAAFPADQQ